MNSPMNVQAYYLGIHRELTLNDRLVKSTLDHFINEVGRFQNTEYPISLTPVIIHASYHEEHKTRVKEYIKILEKATRKVMETPAYQAYFGLTESEIELAKLPLIRNQLISVCRLDGYIDSQTHHLKILEHNADSPAGIFFTPRLNLIIQKTLSILMPELVGLLVPEQFNEPLTLKTFFESYTPKGHSLKLDIIQETGRSNIESLEMAEAFQDMECSCRVSDPAEIGDASVLWNKINTVHWRDLVMRRPELIKGWINIVRAPQRQHLNHFAARVVVENKRCMAFLQDPRYRSIFNTREQSLIETMCPWTAICDKNLKINWKNFTGLLQTLLINNKDSFVLKQPFDIRGDGVIIGKDCSEAQWRPHVTHAFQKRHICQEYVSPLQLPIVERRGNSPSITVMNTSLDTFVLDSEVVGYGAKASTLNKVNLFKGGRKLSTLIGRSSSLQEN